jgi:hypothetical protein
VFFAAFSIVLGGLFSTLPVTSLATATAVAVCFSPEVTNPVLEAMRRLWWRAFDRVSCWILFVRLSIHHRIYGPEPPTSPD